MKEGHKKPSVLSPNPESIRIIIIYLVLGGLWILLSDRLLVILTRDSTGLGTWLQTTKGFLYVVVTAAIFYFLINRSFSELHRSEGALRKSESKYRELVQNANSIILRMDMKGNVAFFNEYAQRFFGYKEERICGQNVIGTIVPETEASVRDLFEMMRGILPNPERYAKSENENARHNGERVWIAWTNKLIVDERGNPKEILCVGNDISERKWAEKALRESEERYRMVVDNSLVGIYIMQDSRFEFVNKRLVELTGYSAEELRCMPSLDLAHPDDRALFAENDTRWFFQETRRQSEFRISTKNGDFRWTELFSGLIQYRGKPALLGHMVDITERKRLEEDLFETKGYLNTLIEHANDVIYTTDMEGNLTFINRQAEAISGLKRIAWLGKSTISFVHPDDVSKVFEQAEILKRGESISSKVRCILRDGQTITFSVHESPIIKAGEVVGIFGIARDITKEVALEAQLRQSQKLEAVGQLAGGVAHDFNNLLTVILGRAQMSLRFVPDDSALYGNIIEIQRAGERAAELTRQLLAFSRKQTIQPRPMNLNRTLEGMQKLLRRLIREDIELQIHASPELWHVMADPSQMEQVVMNLALNAQDAIIGYGRIAIETANVQIELDGTAQHSDQKPGRCVMLSVTDTGHGMSEEMRSRIFEPFFTTKPEGKGTGLGLATVHGIVEQHLGNITVKSEVGKGTVFEVYLPASDTTEEMEPRDEDGPAPKGSETIFVVEDEPSVRRMAVKSLRDLGYKVFEASDGAEALLMLNSMARGPDLLLSDVVMPGLNGPELAEEFLKRFPEKRILFTSGYTDGIIQRHEMLAMGANLLQKPYTPSRLAQEVREILDRVIFDSTEIRGQK